MTRFVCGTVEAVNVMKENKDFAIKTFIKYTQLDEEAAGRAVEWYAETMQGLPAVNIEGMKTVVGVVAQRVLNAANLDVNTIVDTSITDEFMRR